MKKFSFDIFIGINDKDSKISTSSIVDLRNDLCRIFVDKEWGFSISTQLGGYVHEDGSYVYEDSIKITIISETDDCVSDELISYLKTKYNQESILVIKKELESSYN